MHEFGALGARVVGAGGGGFALVIGEVDIKRKLLESGYGEEFFSVKFPNVVRNFSIRIR